MNREFIIAKIISQLNEKLKAMKKFLEETQDSIKQAPTPMESHSDTSRFQFNQLADDVRYSIRRIERAISEINESKIEIGRVGQNSIVKIKKRRRRILLLHFSFGA